MTTVDDIFRSTSAAGTEKQANTYDREEYLKKKAEERAEMFELADTAALEVCSGPDKLEEYLDVQARFFLYSATNALLITAQMPNASMLKSFDDWKAAGVSVKKGEKVKIRLIMPGKEYTRNDGSKGTSWDVKKVYDISQTNSEEKAKTEIRLDPEFVMRCLLENPPVKAIASDNLPNNMCAFYSPENESILVKRNSDVNTALREFLAEMAHATLAIGNEEYVRESASDIATCVSYIISRRFGLDTSKYDLTQTAAHLAESENSREIRGTLSDIRGIAKSIAQTIEKAHERMIQQKTAKSTGDRIPDER